MSKQLERLASPHMGKKGSLSFANKSVTFAFLSDSKQGLIYATDRQLAWIGDGSICEWKNVAKTQKRA
jgi:hypothetical protein